MNIRLRKECILFCGVAALSVSAFWLWYRVVPLLVRGEFSGYAEFLFPTVALVFSASFFHLAALFIKNRWIVCAAVCFIFSAPYFFIEASMVVFGALFLSLLLGTFSFYRTHREESFSLGFSITKTARAGLPLYFTAAAIIVATFYLVNLDAEKALESFLPRSAFDLALKPLQGSFGRNLGLPVLSPNAKIGDALVELALERLKKQGIDIASVPKKDLDDFLSRTRGELELQLGIIFNPEERLSDVFYRSVNERLRDLVDPFRIYLPFAAAFAFFFAFKAFTLPLYYVSVLITFLLIKLSILIKILQREKRQIEVERLTL